MTLHNESLDAMGASEKHKKLIEVFNLYNDVEALRLDIKHLEITKARHDAGVEWCGNPNHRKLDKQKEFSVIKDIKEGKPIKEAANNAGVSREWARELILRYGFVYDKESKTWVLSPGKIQSFEITRASFINQAHVTAGEPKFDTLLKYLKCGASLKKAAMLTGMSASHANEKLHEMGYVHKNKKWYRQVT